MKTKKRTGEPNETTEMWRDVRHQRQDDRAERLPERQRDIIVLTELGYSVLQLTDYQFRINNRVDLYPTRQRYHHLETNKRGRYTEPHQCLQRLGVHPPHGQESTKPVR